MVHMSVRPALSIAVLAVLAVLALPGCGTKTKSGASNGGDSEPVVSAAANVNNGLAPLTVQFTGVAAGGNGSLDYVWEFGDGEEAQELSPSHVYVSTGTYTAAFTATDDDGDSASAEVTIQVGSPSAPAVTASANPLSGLAPLSVQFSTTVTGGDAPVTVSWNFGDGETAAETNPTHVYQATGSYGATVTATDATGDVATATVVVQVGDDSKPVVTISANPSAGPAPLAVAFTAQAVGGNTPLAYAWEFGDATTGTGASANHTYAADGSYAAKVTVTDGDGDMAIATVTIVVNTTAASKPDLQLAGFSVSESGLDDLYEPNDSAASDHYLGDYGTGNAVYDVGDGYVDPVDLLYQVDVINFGSEVTSLFDVDFYGDSPAAPSATALGDDWRTLSGMPTNATERLFFTVTDPAPSVARQSYVRADTFDEVDEAVEDNNLIGALSATATADEDWYSVYETAGFDITITLDQLPADYDVRLYDETGTELAYSINAGTTSESIVHTAASNGLYYVQIHGWNGARSATQPYHLRVVVE